MESGYCTVQTQLYPGVVPILLPTHITSLGNIRPTRWTCEKAMSKSYYFRPEPNLRSGCNWPWKRNIVEKGPSSNEVGVPLRSARQPTLGFVAHTSIAHISESSALLFKYSHLHLGKFHSLLLSSSNWTFSSRGLPPSIHFFLRFISPRRRFN